MVLMELLEKIDDSYIILYNTYGEYLGSTEKNDIDLNKYLSYYVECISGTATYEGYGIINITISRQ